MLTFGRKPPSWWFSAICRNDFVAGRRRERLPREARQYRARRHRRGNFNSNCETFNYDLSKGAESNLFEVLKTILERGRLMSRGPHAVWVGTDDALGYAASADRKFWDFLESVPDAMALSDHEGRIVWVNANTERMFGYSRDELINERVEILAPDRFRARHPEHRTTYYANPDIRPMGVGRDVWARRKDGVEVPVEINLSPVEIAGNTLVWSAIRNTSDRERSIARLRAGMENRRLGLTGLISLCAWCKRVRDEAGFWEQLESYVESHAKAKFTHGICPDCLKKLDPAHHKYIAEGGIT